MANKQLSAEDCLSEGSPSRGRMTERVPQAVVWLDHETIKKAQPPVGFWVPFCRNKMEHVVWFFGKERRNCILNQR